MHDWPPPSWTTADLLQADVDWVLARPHKKIAGWLAPKMKEYIIGSIVEFGCGSGLLAAELPPIIEYFGFDKNEWFLARAVERSKSWPSRIFADLDVRNDRGQPLQDLSMAWSFLKHFGLDEFDGILTKILACGRCCAFNVSHLPFDLDDGKDFHHVYVTEERVRKLIEAAGHEVVDCWTMDTWPAHDQTAMGLAYWTRRKDVNREDAEKIAALTSMPSDIVITTPPATVNTANSTYLEVDGLVVKPDFFHEYSLRWSLANNPALYHKGKRVTKKWRLSLDVDVPADEHGGNANTE